MKLNIADVEKRIKKALQSGNVILGLNETIRMAKLGKADLLVISNNCPKKDDLLYYAKLSNINVFVFPGTNIDLGETCRKPYSVSALAIKEE